MKPSHQKTSLATAILFSLAVISANAYTLPGAVIGSSGSWGNLGNTITNAFDGNTNTFYDAVNATGDWAELDFWETNGTPSAPAAPTGLAATPGNAQVALSWNASSGATSYNVKRSTTSGSGYTNIATGVAATSFTDTGLVNGTTYYYVVS